jgi:NADH-quinone oxidoreductase subunit C
MSIAVQTVLCETWHETLVGLVSEGFGYLDLLTAIDRGDVIEVLVQVVNPDGAGQRRVSVRVPTADPRLPTITTLFPSAGWHEREAAEMFGIVFVGHPDPRPLLRRSGLGRPPLRTTTVLAARVAVPWPGAADPDSAGKGARRRQLPPGVPAGWLTDGSP